MRIYHETDSSIAIYLDDTYEREHPG
jgi:hypothetical protein